MRVNTYVVLYILALYSSEDVRSQQHWLSDSRSPRGFKQGQMLRKFNSSLETAESGLYTDESCYVKQQVDSYIEREKKKSKFKIRIAG